MNIIIYGIAAAYALTAVINVTHKNYHAALGAILPVVGFTWLAMSH